MAPIITSQRPEINRVSICQALLNACGGTNYLEIGVNHGNSFIPIQAKVKWGVDPDFTLTYRRQWKYKLFWRLRIKEERLFRETSDQFFASKSSMLALRGVDVAFIDGLHTYEQVLKDVKNSLAVLRNGGAIVIHDCNPRSEIHATPAQSIQDVAGMKIANWNGEWNGDVWKAVVHLRSMHPELQTVVLDCDQGVGVVRRARNQYSLGSSIDTLRSLNYKDLDADREHLLGLKPAHHIWEIVRAISLGC